MKKTGIQLAAMIVAVTLFAPVALRAQDDKKDKEDKEVKLKEKKEGQQIVITRKSDKDEKVVVEINGDKVLINGKPLEEYKDKDGDISVRLNKLKDMDFLTRIPNVSGSWSYNGNDNFKLNDNFIYVSTRYNNTYIII